METATAFGSAEPAISSAGQSGTAPSFPDNHDPAFPKAGGYPDWPAAVLQFDPVNAAAVAALYPRCPQDWPPHLARKYVTVRRKGALSDKLIRLAQARYKVTYDNFGPKDKTWKVRTLGEFLIPSYLPIAQGAMLQWLREDLAYWRGRLEDWKADTYRMNYLRNTWEIIQKARKEGRFSLRSWVSGSPEAASFMLLCHNSDPSELEVQRECREDIKQHLTEATGLLRLCLEQKQDPLMVFGFFKEEIEEMHKEHAARLNREIEELESLQ